MSGLLRHLPNALTCLRIALVLPFIVFMVQGRYDAALWTLLVAGGTDGLDGLLARRFGWRTQFGSIADPVADKLLMVSTYLALGFTHNIPWWVVAVVVTRDLYIFCGAIAYWFLVGRYEGKPTMLSKICTFLMIALGLGALSNLVWAWLPDAVLIGLSCVVVALCGVSMVQYTLLGVTGYRNRAKPEAPRD